MGRLANAARAIVADRVFVAVVLLAVGGGVLLYRLRGAAAVVAALEGDLRLFAVLAFFVPAVLLAAAFIEVMMPRGLVERWLGAGAGFRGIMVSTVAGMLTPGGPFMAFPLVRALLRAGAAWAPLIAYVTAWSLLSLPRMLVFEIPLTGIELPLTRFLACLALPPLAGYAADRLARIWRPPARGGR